MAIAFRAVGTRARTISVDVDVNPGLPAGQVQDDILILVQIAYISGTSITVGTIPAVSGYTTLNDTANTGSTSRQLRLHISWRRAGASESAPACQMNGDATGTITDRSFCSFLLAVSGAKLSGSPFEAEAYANQNTVTLSATGVTTLTASALVLAILGMVDDKTYSLEAFTDPSAPTVDLDELDTAGTDNSELVASGIRATAGASGNFTTTAAPSTPVVQSRTAVYAMAAEGEVRRDTLTGLKRRGG